MRVVVVTDDDDAVGSTRARCLPSIEGFETQHPFLEPLVSPPFCAHVYFSVPRIVRNLRANPIRNLHDLIRLREFDFGNYNTLQNIVVDIDLPSSVFMDDEVPHLVQNIPPRTSFARFLRRRRRVSHIQILFEPYPSCDFSGQWLPCRLRCELWLYCRCCSLSIRLDF
jgi:hypothetical protein